MSSVVADTQVLVWYLYDSPSLSAAAGAVLDASASMPKGIYLSAVSLSELTYLVEKGRLSREVRERVVARLAPGGGLTVVPVDRGVTDALALIPRNSVPDMPDRIVAATTVHLGLPLVSREGKVRASEVQTIW